jgi:TIR domain-containing protein/von Hippel-Lindau disease tumor suppressor protein
MPGIFISYRRSDAQMVAGRLRDSLAIRMGGKAIFRDKTNIKGGEDFEAAIDRTLRGQVIVLALIGPNWATALNKVGARLLDDPANWNRIELECAFKRNVRIIPVLVDEAQMPQEAELPESLTQLTRISALRLRDDDWDTDIERLERAINALYPRFRARRSILVATTAAVAIIVGGIAYELLMLNFPHSTLLPTPIAGATVACDQEKNLRSLGTTQPTTISFTNKTSGTVRIYWLNYQGDRELFAPLERGAVFRAATYIGHPWVVTDASDKCRAIYMPTVDPQNIDISR